MSTDFEVPPRRPPLPRGCPWLKLALYPVLSALALWLISSTLSSRGSVDDQVYSALGCGSDASLLILKLQPDGRILWPDTHVATIAESALLLPSWCARQARPALAILADQDALLSEVTPLLQAAEQLGVRQAILATPTT